MIKEIITKKETIAKNNKDRTICFAPYWYEYELVLLMLTTCMQIASAHFINNMIERVHSNFDFMCDIFFFFTTDQLCYEHVYETEHRKSK